VIVCLSKKRTIFCTIFGIVPLQNQVLTLGMASESTLLERAFALAKNGKLASSADLRRALKTEGFSERDFVHLQGRALMKQLRALIGDEQRKAQVSDRSFSKGDASAERKLDAGLRATPASIEV
jgi:hypothetical protein